MNTHETTAHLMPRVLFITTLLFLPVLCYASAFEVSLVPESPLESCSEMPVSSLTDEISAEPSRFSIPVVRFSAQGRMFGVIPNYRAAQYQENYQPLSTRQKYEIARKDSFDWPNFLLLAGFALQSQIASGGFRQNGGLSGFGKFYGRAMADQVIGSYITEAFLPSLLHEDPRFFRLGTGSILHRASHAASNVFVTRTESGRARFNVSEVAGNASVVAITSIYYPQSQSPGEGALRLGMNLGNDVLSNLITEFLPDIKRHFKQTLLSHRAR